MNPYTDHAAGLVELQNELGDDCPSFVWSKTRGAAETIRILPGSLLLRSANSVGGLTLDSDFACTCLLADFSETPSSNQIITYSGKRLSIDSVTLAAGGKQVRIKANDAAQGG